MISPEVDLFGQASAVRARRSSSPGSLQQVARALGGEVSGGQVLAPGPGHSPEDRSLSVKLDGDEIVVHSFAGNDPIECKDYVRQRCGLPEWKPNGAVNGVKGTSSKRSRVVAEYVYKRADGSPYLRVQRTETKAFWQSHWDGAAWLKGKPPGPKIPYRLPELAERRDELVYIVEGEKDADRLAEYNLVVTTSSEGAGKWTVDLNDHFRGRHVRIISDNDDPGREHARNVAEHLKRIAATVAIIELPDLRPKGDVSDWLDAGGTIERLAQLAERASNAREAPTSPRRFPLVPFEQLTPTPDSDDLISGLFPREGLAVVWGPRKCGKSFWVMDAMLHVALGWPYRGRKVAQGTVVYCAFEGQNGYRNRATAFRQRRLPDHSDPVPFYLLAAPISFAKDHASLISEIRAQLGPGTKPVAVVLDTLNRSLDGSENDDRDMSSYIKAADAVREAFGCLVVIVHHCGHETTRPRGHTSLGCAADIQIAVKCEGGVNITSTVEFMKDGPGGEVITSRLEVVEIGIKGNSDALTSCVVVEADAVPAATKAASKQDKWWNSTLCKALMASLDGAQLIRPFPDGPSVSAVPVETVRAEFYLSYHADSKDAKRTAFNNQLKTAVEKEFVQTREIDKVKMIWLCKTKHGEHDRIYSPRSAEIKSK